MHAQHTGTHAHTHTQASPWHWETPHPGQRWLLTLGHGVPGRAHRDMARKSAPRPPRTRETSSLLGQVQKPGGPARPGAGGLRSPGRPDGRAGQMVWSCSIPSPPAGRPSRLLVPDMQPGKEEASCSCRAPGSGASLKQDSLLLPETLGGGTRLVWGPEPPSREPAPLRPCRSSRSGTTEV